MTHIRLLLVDDHILFRESLRRLLAASEVDFEVVADCGTTEDASDVLKRQSINVILLDFDLGGAHPTRCITALHGAGYAGRILMVTAGMTAIESSMALRYGASRVFLKSNSPTMLTQAIRLVANGSTWFDQRLLQRVVDGQNPSGHSDEPETLTSRQRQVLEGVFEGLANKEIGARLGVSEGAVKTTLQQLFQKTGVRTRSQLVRIALERSFLRTQGLLQDRDRVSAGA